MHPYEIRDVVSWPFVCLLIASVPSYSSKKNDSPEDFETIEDEISALKKFGL